MMIPQPAGIVTALTSDHLFMKMACRRCQRKISNEKVLDCKHDLMSSESGFSATCSNKDVPECQNFGQNRLSTSSDETVLPINDANAVRTGTASKEYIAGSMQTPWSFTVNFKKSLQEDVLTNSDCINLLMHINKSVLQERH